MTDALAELGELGFRSRLLPDKYVEDCTLCSDPSTVHWHVWRHGPRSGDNSLLWATIGPNGWKLYKASSPTTFHATAQLLLQGGRGQEGILHVAALLLR